MTEGRISKRILQNNQEEINTDEEWKILKAQVKKTEHASLPAPSSGEKEKGEGGRVLHKDYPEQNPAQALQCSD